MINRGWLKIEALRLAKIAVKEDIRAKGLRLKDYEAKHITRLAELWFSEHRAELIGQATIGLFFSTERNAKHMHKRRGPQKSMASAVHISGAK
jgi:hypothetical protein